MNGKTTTALLIVVLLLIVGSGALYAYQNMNGSKPVPAPTTSVTDNNGSGTGTTTTPITPPANTNQEFAIKVGQKIQVANFTLTLNKIAEDSRCPVGETCIWAGRVVADFDAVSGTDHQTISLSTASSTAFGGYDFKIETVSPDKTSGTTTASGDYSLVVSYISNN